MCKILRIARSTYYYEVKVIPDESDLYEAIQQTFQENREVYGARKLKKALEKKQIFVSRRKITRIMKELGLKSAYSDKRFKVGSKSVNNADIPNILARNFNNHSEYAAVVSDLTYVRVNYKWNYICILLDLYNREIIGYSAGPRKDAQLVFDAFATVSVPLDQIQIFHTDRGNEFDNMLIDEVLEVFNIQRSLSLKGCPYDNSVAEATFNLIKAEFVHRHHFKNLEDLRLHLADYVNWFNNVRLHSTLGYMSPVDYRNQKLSFLSENVLP
jgi:transposase InsO family protein